VTGIMPLFLFNEHWEIAKRNIPSIFGFMCTLDIMGYADDQFYVIPFTVLFKCYEKVQENSNDVNKKMLKLVLDTCVQIVIRHEIFSKNLIEKLKQFESSPSGRTKDCIPNFRVFIAQVISAIEAGVIDKNSNIDWAKIIRFLAEEGSRRLISKQAEVPSKKQLANYLNDKKTDEIVDKAMKIKDLSADKKLTQAEVMELLTGGPKNEEGKKGAAEEEVKELVDAEVDSEPWLEQLKKKESNASKSIKKFYKSINKSLSWINVLINTLEIDSLKITNSFEELKLFKDPVIVYAMLLQNSLHPSNKARREAIEAGKYAEILNWKDAEEYLKSTYRNLLELEISGEETRIIMLQTSDLTSNISEMSLIIKDARAFAELIKSLKVGDGGLPKLIKNMCNKHSLNPFEKLKAIMSMKWDGLNLFTDNYSKKPRSLYWPKRKILYKLYIRYTHVHSDMSESEFDSLFSVNGLLD
jgi:hypothetical protein